MRFLMKAVTPTDRGNQAVREGTLASIVEDLLAATSPEAVYFGLQDGKRTTWMVVDLQDATEIPAICERLFLALGSACELIPVMTPADLANAGPHFEAALKKYA